MVNLERNAPYNHNIPPDQDNYYQGRVGETLSDPNLRSRATIDAITQAQSGIRYKPPMQPGRVNFEALYEMGGVVLNPIPEQETDRYRYWRGASLAKIAMNFARGNNSINAGDSPEVHFADFRSYAENVAKDLTGNARSTQLSEEDLEELSAFTGMPIDAPLPAIVFALDDMSNSLPLKGSTQGMRHGYVYHGYLPIAMLDEYSRSIIDSLRVAKS